MAFRTNEQLISLHVATLLMQVRRFDREGLCQFSLESVAIAVTYPQTRS